MIYDPDYARAYSIIRCTAWQYGYAACLHGSFTRDLDVVLVPWADQVHISFDHLMNLLAERTGLTKQGKSRCRSPHGRLAQSLLFPGFGDPRWIDLSVMSKGEPIVTLRSWDAEDIAIAAADAGITGSKFEALLVAPGERR